MSKGIAIFLCNLTMNMAQPWVDADYEVVMVDPQHPAGVHTDGLVTRVGATILGAMPYISACIRSGRVVFVGGFPPCTDVAVSGSLHFEKKRAKNPHFQAQAALVFEQCRMVGEAAGVAWFAENPISVFSSIIGKPQHIFHPWHFTGLCIDDNYTKTTCLWAGNDFAFPELDVDPTVAKAVDLWERTSAGKGFAAYRKMRKEGTLPYAFSAEELELLDNWLPDDRIHKCSPGEERANIRSATPRGFAQAVFMANAPHLKPEAMRLAA